MPIANMLSITSNPFLSMMIWIVLMLATLYFARKPFHLAVGSLAKIIHNAMRLTAASVISAEKKLVQRNHEVLMAAGLQKAEGFRYVLKHLKAADNIKGIRLVDGDHGLEHLVPGVGAFEDRVVEHAAIPTDVLDAACRRILEPIAGTLDDVELAVGVGGEAMPPGFIVRAAAVNGRVVLGHVEIDRP